MEYIDNSPNASKLMESLRSTGYDNYSAICDIIDNSLDANADIVKVSIGTSDKVVGGIVIAIADNGEGMTQEVLSEALKLGSMTDHGVEHLGKFGMGLITASISLGRRLTIITKREGQYLTGIQDLDDIQEKNQFVKVIRQSNNVEISSFDEKLGGSETGTLVLVQKVDNLKNSNISVFKNTLAKKCAEIYRYFLDANKKIYINASEVMPSDPLELNDTDTEILVDESKTFEVNGKKAPIRVRIVRLAKKSDSDPDNNQNIRNQGFYIMRNNRQISSGDNLDKLFTKHGSLNRFRAEIFFNSDADEQMGVKFTKDGSNIGLDAIYGWVENVSTPHIRYIASQSIKDGKKQRAPIVRTGTINNITNKAATLKKPKILDTPSAPLATKLQGVDSDIFTKVDIVVESRTRLAPLFQFEITGGKTVIEYNQDHPFYDQIASIATDNPTLSSAIDYMIYSTVVALVDITSTEDRWHLQEDFLDKLSDNLRSLLS